MSLTVSSNTLPDGSKVYTGTYGSPKKAGLVKIKSHYTASTTQLFPDCLFPQDAVVKVVIKHHTRKDIIVHAQLSKSIAALVDEGESPDRRTKWHGIHSPDNHYQENGWTWQPWWDDAFIDSKRQFQSTHDAKLRGGNRLTVTLRFPGLYDHHTGRL